MEFQDVIDIYRLLEKNGITLWIDGGWGVDALLEKQTRPHEDLDIAIQWKDIPKLREVLAQLGYKQMKEDSKWNFVLKNDIGHEVDVHAFIFDNKGNVVEGIKYPKESLTGTGKIDGQIVKCISPEYMVKFHSGYKLTEKDFQDVSALCEKFGIALSEAYNRFKQKS